MHRTQRLALSSFALALVAGCTPKIGDLGELTQGSSDTTQGSTSAPDTGDDTVIVDPTTGDGTTAAAESSTGEPAPATGVDIIFIVDNSGSMAEEQQRLAAAITALVDPLVGSGRDLRIAVTTTDVGNPRCAISTPESGAFQTASCRARIADGEWAFLEEDFSAACLDVCDQDALAFTATTTADDPVAKVRPWLEWDGVAGNVEGSPADALGCMLPQGVAGCGFEAPLEAMLRALERTQSPGDPQFGFLRDDADLLVVIVTDEADCSPNPEFGEIFTTEKVFWNSPDDPAPTSAMCWRAGGECTGGPGTYDDCVAVDRDISGAITVDPAAAVLQPLSRYQGVLSTIAADKQAAGSAAKVQVAAIAGVPIGYPQVPLVFKDSPDPDIQSSFGIAPGCVAADSSAAPPLRTRELVEQTAPLGAGLFSICESDFQSSLAAISGALMGD